jgi:galactonate dehydratase
MRITGLETWAVGAGWKNWLFVRVTTDEGIHGIGEGTLNGFIRTTETGLHELEHLVLGQDPRRVRAIARRMLDSVSLDGGHIHRTIIAAVEVACWDIIGKSLGVPIHQLLGGRVRDSVLGYANGWYRTERTPEGFLAAARAVLAKGFKALKLDPFGTAQGFISESELGLAYDIVRTLRENLPADTLILIDVHARFTESEAIRVARRFAPLDIFWWEEPTTRDRQEAVHPVARASPIPVATGEMYDTVGQFFTLAEGGGVNIFQPEPMSLGGIASTLAVADLALAHGSYIAPHQSGGPVATAVCLQLAACLPNFLIQEHFDAFNEAWTRDLVTWHPTIDPGNGHLSLPEGPGLGLDLNVEVARAHPYDPRAYLNIFEEGWEKRVGSGRPASTRPTPAKPRRAGHRSRSARAPVRRSRDR